MPPAPLTSSPWLSWLPPALRQPLAQKLLGNGGWLLGEKLLRAVGELTLGVWLARYLGPDQFGVLSYAIAFVRIFMPLGSLGLWQIVVRDLVNHPDRPGDILGSALGLSLVGGVLAFSLCLTLLPRVRPQDPVVLTLVAWLGVALLCQAADLVGFWFQAQLQIKPEAIARGGAYLLGSMALAIALVAQAPLLLVGSLFALEPLLKVLGLTVLYRRWAADGPPWRFRWPLARRLLSQGWLLMVTQFAILLFLRVDQIMVAQLAGDQAAGLYAAAVKLSEGWYFLLTILSTTLFPVIVTLQARDPVAYQRQLFRLLRGVALLAYGVMGAFLGLAPLVVPLLFGSAYQGAVPVLQIHALSSVFMGLGLVRGLWLTAENYLGLYVAFASLGAGLNLGLNWLLVPSYGAIGASVATLIAYGLAHYAAGFCLNRTRPFTQAMTAALLLRPHPPAPWSSPH